MNLKPPREYRDPANIIENKQEHASRKLGTFYDLPEGVNQLQKTFYPSCFDSVDQWLEYRKSARTAKQVCTICEDCTHQYQAEMIKQGRCDRVRGIEWMAYTSRDRKKVLSRSPAQLSVKRVELGTKVRQPTADKSSAQICATF